MSCNFRARSRVLTGGRFTSFSSRLSCLDERPRPVPPVAESAGQWARLDGCPAQPEMVGARDGVQVLRYGPGRHNTETPCTIVTGNGHHGPGTIEPLPPALGGPTRDPFSATDPIREFFQPHPLPTAPPT